MFKVLGLLRAPVHQADKDTHLEGHDRRDVLNKTWNAEYHISSFTILLYLVVDLGEHR